MLDLLDKPPLTGGTDLPPMLQPHRRREPEYVITPSIIHIETQSKTADRQNNWWTIHYVWMARMWNDGRIEVAHVNSRRYAQWLEVYPAHKWHNGIPPHIQFGGAIEAGQGDPTFHSRWVEYAKATFVC